MKTNFLIYLSNNGYSTVTVNYTMTIKEFLIQKSYLDENSGESFLHFLDNGDNETVINMRHVVRIEKTLTDEKLNFKV